jgi:hypothetical protein
VTAVQQRWNNWQGKTQVFTEIHAEVLLCPLHGQHWNWNRACAVRICRLNVTAVLFKTEIEMVKITGNDVEVGVT